LDVKKASEVESKCLDPLRCFLFQPYLKKKQQTRKKFVWINYTTAVIHFEDLL
jgi:hypothetical protein